MLCESAIGAGAGCFPFGGVTTRFRRGAAGRYPNGLRNGGDGKGAPLPALAARPCSLAL